MAHSQELFCLFCRKQELANNNYYFNCQKCAKQFELYRVETYFDSKKTILETDISIFIENNFYHINYVCLSKKTEIWISSEPLKSLVFISGNKITPANAKEKLKNILTFL